MTAVGPGFVDTNPIQGADAIRASVFEPNLQQILQSDGTWDRSNDESGAPDFVTAVDAVCDRLLASRCFVLFSGGVDSSLLLALLTRRARQIGSALPVPITYRYADESTHEHRFQHALVDHLGITEWHVDERGDACEAIGPVAERFIGLVGTPMMPTAHVHLPTFERLGAEGPATVVTGDGGDEFFGRRWSAIPGATARTMRHRWQDPLFCGRVLATASRELRPVPRHADPRRFRPWLTSPAVADAREAGLLTPSGHVRSRVWEVERRTRRGWVMRTSQQLAKSAARFGVELVNPWFDPHLLRSLVASYPARDFISRPHLIQRIWPDLLPDEVLTRRSKAVFTNVYFGPRSASFAASWDGRSLRSEYIDWPTLRRCWSDSSYQAASLHVLQMAWMSQKGLL